MILNVGILLTGLLTLLVYASNPPWFFWGVSQYIIFFAVVLLFILVALSKKKSTRAFRKALPVVVVSFAFFVLVKGVMSAELRVSTLLLFVTYVTLFFVSDEYKEKAFTLFSKSLATLVFFSCTFWLVHNYVIQIPFYFSLAYADLLGKGEDLSFQNYIFFIQPELDYFRFYSVFDEPGVLGLLCAMVLYGNRYDLKDRNNIILLIGGGATFSLAFYVITLIGIIVCLAIERKIKQIFIFVSTCAMIFPFLYSMNLFQSLIVGRALGFRQAVSERTGYYLDQYFSEFITRSQFLYGESLSFLSQNKYLLEGQGYKFFFIEYGLIGFILMLLLYVFMVDVRRLNMYVFFFFVLFLLSFIQRPFMFTPWQIALFSITLPVLYKAKPKYGTLYSKAWDIE